MSELSEHPSPGGVDEQLCSRCGAPADGRYCPSCGLDRDPAREPYDINQHRLAQHREQGWLTDHPGAATTKNCPDCAETVAAAANVCRYCGYRFDTGQPGRAGASSTPTSTSTAAVAPAHKSPGGAAVMGIVLAGLGHLYVGEYGRAALVFVSAVAAGVGVALAGGGFALIGLAILAFSARDAYVGAQRLNEEGRPRPLAGPIWVIVLIAAAALTIGIAKAGSVGSSGSVDTDAVADQIKPDLERQLQDQFSDSTVTVDSVTCISASSRGGTCLADVSDSTGNSEKVSITYSVDASSGNMIWRTDQ